MTSIYAKHKATLVKFIIIYVAGWVYLHGFTMQAHCALCTLMQSSRGRWSKTSEVTVCVIFFGCVEEERKVFKVRFWLARRQVRGFKSPINLTQAHVSQWEAMCIISALFPHCTMLKQNVDAVKHFRLFDIDPLTYTSVYVLYNHTHRSTSSFHLFTICHSQKVKLSFFNLYFLVLKYF